ncbi:MAG: hypothetical protein AB7O62_05960 [Pirellulales bacterium]
MTPDKSEQADRTTPHRAKLRGLVGIVLVVPLLLLLALYVVDSSSRAAGDRISAAREAELKPVIRYMEAFIRDHHRLPTGEEFRAGTAGMGRRFVLSDRTDTYAASKGAKGELDYLIGTWRVDWYHYYKSWDNSFLNGHDEFPER